MRRDEFDGGQGHGEDLVNLRHVVVDDVDGNGDGVVAVVSEDVAGGDAAEVKVGDGRHEGRVGRSQEAGGDGVVHSDDPCNRHGSEVTGTGTRLQ